MHKAEQAEKRAYQYHCQGFHCAEAVCRALCETHGGPQGPATAKAATAFGGGLGRTHGEICGTVSGAVLALGLLFGREKPGEDWSRAAEPAAELRKRFLAQFGTLNCGELLAQFGPQSEMARCKRLSGEVAGLVGIILRQGEETTSRRED